MVGKVRKKTPFEEKTIYSTGDCISCRGKSLLDILKVGTSAGGAKPKAIIAYNDDTIEVRSGQVKAPEGFTYWLLKFDGAEGDKLKDNSVEIF
jgi:HipA-like N-terminal domain.